MIEAGVHFISAIYDHYIHTGKLLHHFFYATVGHYHLNEFFSVVDSLLVPNGVFVMQAITMPDSRYPVYVKSADFCNTIIFPGGCCPR